MTMTAWARSPYIEETRQTYAPAAPDGWHAADDDEDERDERDEKTKRLESLLYEGSKKRHPYSVGRAIWSAIRNEGMPRGIAREISDVCDSDRGFKIPFVAPARVRTSASSVESRALDTSAGGASIAQPVPPKMLIDILRPKLVIEKLGGTIATISLERGYVQIPIKSSASTVNWIGESAPVTPSNMVVESIQLKPKTASAQTRVTRRMLGMAQDDFETLVILDLMTGLAHAIDQVAINGAGPVVANQPLGLLQMPPGAIPSLPAPGGAFPYSHLVDMQLAAANANADGGIGKMSWLTSPQGRATLALTDMSTSGQGRFCWRGEPGVMNGEQVTLETVLGQTAFQSTAVPSGATATLIHGDFTRAWVNIFKGIDVLVNPFTLATDGYVEITAYVDIDVAFPSPASFVICPNVTPIPPT